MTQTINALPGSAQPSPNPDPDDVIPKSPLVEELRAIDLVLHLAVDRVKADPDNEKAPPLVLRTCDTSARVHLARKKLAEGGESESLGAEWDQGLRARGLGEVETLADNIREGKGESNGSAVKDKGAGKGSGERGHGGSRGRGAGRTRH